MKKTAKPPRAPTYPRHTPVKSHLNRRKTKAGHSFDNKAENADRSIFLKLFDFFMF